MDLLQEEGGKIMQAVLVFDMLTEEEELRQAVNGFKWRRVVQDLDEQLRTWLKYGNSELRLDDHTLDSIRNMLREYIADEGLTLL